LGDAEQQGGIPSFGQEALNKPTKFTSSSSRSNGELPSFLTNSTIPVKQSH